jgi:hypothetical protein
MRIAILRTVLAVAALGTAASGLAQAPGKVDLETAELVAELIGAPVYAADGPQVGEVTDIAIDSAGQPDKLRFATAAALGLGPRMVEVPQGGFMLLRGAVVLDMPAEVVQSLPGNAPPGNGDK